MLLKNICTKCGKNSKFSYCKGCKKEYDKKYSLKNRVKRNKIASEWQKKNRKGATKNVLRYYYNNKEKKLKYKKIYVHTHWEEIKAKKRQRFKQDNEFAIKIRLASCLYSALKRFTKLGKITSSIKYGIDYGAIIEHLKPFPKDISNYHIDHIKPLCSFNLNKKEEVKMAFDKGNLQWLLAKENRIKNGKVERG